MIDAILDTGPLVGSLDSDDQWNGWSSKQFAAIQQPALKIWSGQAANMQLAQQALLHRAECNRAARRGEYGAEMEIGAPGNSAVKKPAA